MASGVAAVPGGVGRVIVGKQTPEEVGLRPPLKAVNARPASSCKYPDKPDHSPLEIFRHIATLSRDAAHANDSINPIFNKEKEQQRLQTAQMIGEIGSQVADIARTQGEIGALKKAQTRT